MNVVMWQARSVLYTRKPIVGCGMSCSGAVWRDLVCTGAAEQVSGSRLLAVPSPVGVWIMGAHNGATPAVQLLAATLG